MRGHCCTHTAKPASRLPCNEQQRERTAAAVGSGAVSGQQNKFAKKIYARRRNARKAHGRDHSAESFLLRHAAAADVVVVVAAAAAAAAVAAAVAVVVVAVVVAVRRRRLLLLVVVVVVGEECLAVRGRFVAAPGKERENANTKRGRAYLWCETKHL